MSEALGKVHNVVLEKFDANMEEATIGGWHVAVGDAIAEGDNLVEIVTDKMTFDYESPVAGTVRRLVAAPGGVIPVGYVIAQVGDADAPLPEVDADNTQRMDAYKRSQEVLIDVGGGAAETTKPRKKGRVRATPAARRLAKQHGLDLADVTPAEDGGILSEEDVQAHLGAL